MVCGPDAITTDRVLPTFLEINKMKHKDNCIDDCPIVSLFEPLK